MNIQAITAYFRTSCLYAASLFLGWQVTIMLVERLAKKTLGEQTYTPLFHLSGLTICTQFIIKEPPARHLPFLGVAYVVLRIFFKVAGTKDEGATTLPPFMTDLVEKARSKPVCPYSGYDLYIEKLEIILLQTERNNGILVGPSGVGKSAIFETIAWQIAHNQLRANSPFIGKRLIEVDITLFVAGAKYVGELENRVKKLLDVVKKDPNIILVMDEIHRIVGAGAGKNNPNGDIANGLKPFLARHGLKILGATTPREYTDNIQNDPTMARRFRKVDVHEPKALECLQMLQNIRNRGGFNNGDHIVTITDEALLAGIVFSKTISTARTQSPHLPQAFPDVATDFFESVRARVIYHQEAPGDTTINLDTVLQHISSETGASSETLRAVFDRFIAPHLPQLA